MDQCEFCKKTKVSLSHTNSCRMLHNYSCSPELLLPLLKNLVERIDNLESQLPNSSNNPPLVQRLNNLEPSEFTFESFYASKQISQKQVDACFNTKINSFVYESDSIKSILAEWFSSSNLPIKANVSKPNTLFIYEDKWIILNAYHLKKFTNALTKKLVKCLNDNNMKHQYYCDYIMILCDNKPQRNTFIKKALYQILTKADTGP